MPGGGMRRLGLAIMVLALVPAQAQAVTLTRADGSGIPRFQAWIDRAPVPTVPGAVRVMFGREMTGYEPTGRTIYVKRGRGLRELELLHELGHDFERKALSTAGWEQWSTEVGETAQRDVRVQTSVGPRWLGMEHFADWYAGCATRNRGAVIRAGMVIGSYGGRMTRAVARSSCAGIWRLDRSGGPAA